MSALLTSVTRSWVVPGLQTADRKRKQNVWGVSGDVESVMTRASLLASDNAMQCADPVKQYHLWSLIALQDHQP